MDYVVKNKTFLCPFPKTLNNCKYEEKGIKQKFCNFNLCKYIVHDKLRKNKLKKLNKG